MEEIKDNAAAKFPVKIIINEKWCKKCSICVAFCPKGVFVADEFGAPLVKNPQVCIKCMLCVVRCPDFAIEVEDAEPKKDR